MRVDAVSRNSDQLDLFYIDSTGRVISSWWHQGTFWSELFSVGGFFPPGAAVTAVARMDNHLDLFVTGNDGRVYTSWWHQGQPWSGINDNWRPIGGFFPPGAPVAAVARTPNNLDLFITGNDGRVYTSWWFQGVDWSGINDNWRPIGGFFPPAAPLGAVARTPTNLDLFITGNDGRVYTSWWFQGVDWSGINDNWRPIGGFFPAAAPVAAVSRKPDHLDLFVNGNDNRAYTSWWVNGSDWSGIKDNWMLIPLSWLLNFTMQVQTQSNWCWAATSTSIAQYYDPATTWTQCTVANGELSRNDCCGGGASGPCNQTNTLDTALSRVGHLDHMVSGTVSRDGIKNEIVAGRPVCARTAWSGGGAHFVAIAGFIEGDLIEVHDPISGVSNVDYDVFVTSYQGSGSWTHSYFTRS
jgi:Papain-like cysteine protease AvrRpt2